MQVTVFGATGKVGRLVVEDLLEQGHSVVAFVHSHTLPEKPGLRFVQGSIYETKKIGEAVKGSQAVISALSSWKAPHKDVLSSAMKALIPAMQDQGIARLVSVTGADARANGDEMGPLHRLSHTLFGFVAKGILEDSEKHLKLLEDSKLQWTVIRSPVMNNFGNPAIFQLSSRRPAPWTTINRHSVALAMVNALSKATYNKKAPYISRK